MKQVIINADDFGLSKGVNEGIIKAHREGPLTSTTLMANMPGFDQAVEMAHAHPKLGVGVHLNILRGRPLLPEHEVGSLISGEHTFVPSIAQLLLRIALKKINFTEVENEFRAQLEKVRDAGIVPSHIDSEKHAHMIRPLFRIVIKLAREYGINRVRFIRELCFSSRPVQVFKSVFISLSSAGLKKWTEKKGIVFPDAFYGVCHSGGITASGLRRVLQKTRDGVTEIMVHPGFITQDMLELEAQIGPYYINRFREKELDALLDRDLIKFIADLDIRLINFNHL